MRTCDIVDISNNMTWLRLIGMMVVILPLSREHMVSAGMSACKFYDFKFQLLTSHDSHTHSFLQQNCPAFSHLVFLPLPYDSHTKMNMDKRQESTVDIPELSAGDNNKH